MAAAVQRPSSHPSPAGGPPVHALCLPPLPTPGPPFTQPAGTDKHFFPHGSHENAPDGKGLIAQCARPPRALGRRWVQPGLPTFLAPLRAVSKKVSLEHPLGRRTKTTEIPQLSHLHTLRKGDPNT